MFCFMTDNLYLQSWSDIIIYFSYTDILATIKKMNFFWCSNLHPSEGSRQILDLQAWGLFIWEKLSRLGEEIIPRRSRHNANFHQKKISVHMTWKFSRLTGISPIANRDLGYAGKYFLIWTHFPGRVRQLFPMKHVQKSIT